MKLLNELVLGFTCGVIMAGIITINTKLTDIRFELRNIDFTLEKIERKL